jgi:hypothetical protein
MLIVANNRGSLMLKNLSKSTFKAEGIKVLHRMMLPDIEMHWNLWGYYFVCGLYMFKNNRGDVI